MTVRSMATRGTLSLVIGDTLEALGGVESGRECWQTETAIIYIYIYTYYMHVSEWRLNKSRSES